MDKYIERCWFCESPTYELGLPKLQLFDRDGNGPYCSSCWEGMIAERNREEKDEFA